MHSKIPFHSINAHLQCQDCSIGCCFLQNGCQLHHHAADSVLTSGCSFISQQICIDIFITFAIFGICIKIEKLSTGKKSMYIHISGGTPSNSDTCTASLSPGGTGGVSGGCGVGSGVGFLSPSVGGAPVPVCLQGDWGFYGVWFWEGRQLSVWLSQCIAGCLPIAAFTFLWPGNTTSRFFCSCTSSWGFIIRNSISSIVARKNPPVATLAIIKARRMSDCSSCTHPPSLAIVADMLRTYNKLFAACTY